MSRTERPNKD